MEFSEIFPNHTTLNVSDTIPLGFSYSVLPFLNLYNGSMDVFTSIYLPLSVFGTVANTLNIIVYLKTGVRDNMTLSFLALSISDLLFLVLMSPHLTVVFMIYRVNYRMQIPIKWLVDRDILFYISYWYAYLFYETSILITVYISVVRCACVAIPFKVKNTFTARRAVAAVIAFFTSVVLLRLPMLMKRQVVRVFDPVSNTSQLMYKEIDDGGLANKLNDILSRNIIPWSSFVTVLTCLVVMVTKLQASARFRSSGFGAGPSQTILATNNVDVDFTETSIRQRAGSEELDDKSFAGELRDTRTYKAISPPRAVQKPAVSDREKHQVLSKRQAQVVRSVVLVAVVFITCQLPSMAYSLARRFESQFNASSKDKVPNYVLLFAFCSNLSKVFTLINASINIVVYYNFNSRYRQCLQELCG